MSAVCNNSADERLPDHADQSETLHRKHRILVVDDNRDSATSMSMLLELMGCEVQTAFDGLEAVSAATQFEPDLVLMDLGLPKLNGFDAGRRIRSQFGDTIVLVALSGWGQEADRQKSKEAGFDRHLTKPADLDVLQELLANTH